MATTTRYFTLLPHGLIDDPSDADAIHKQTMALYTSADLPGEPGSRRSSSNILWRHEAAGIVVSADLPASDVPEGARSLVNVTEYNAGDKLAFAVTFDAIVRVRGRDLRTLDAGEWFTRKAASALGDISIDHLHGSRVMRRGHHLEHVSAAGTATVQDEDALDRLLRVGVGRSKTFGCGLLTVKVLP